MRPILRNQKKRTKKKYYTNFKFFRNGINMGLTIELSFSISKLSNVTQFKQLLSDLAEKYNSISNYFMSMK